MSSIDAELASICGEASSPYADRVRLIHRLPSNLAPEQLERCRAFLGSPLAGQPLSDLEFNGLKNELVFALLRQREGLTELAELLVRMSRAPDTDATWRDYSVQFLGKCYPRIHDARSREAMAEALWKALKTQRRSRAAGSAARQLMTLGRSFPEFPPDKVSAASLEALLDPASSDETRTALLQVCGTLGERGALPTARVREGGPVLDTTAVHVIETATHVGDGYHRVIADFGDGTVLYDGYVVAGQVVEGMSVTMTLWGTNSTFEGGTQEKTFTRESFDAAGELHFSILGGRSFTTCMTVILYQDGEEVWRLQ